MSGWDNDKVASMGIALTRFYNAANATFSDADHIRNDVPLAEAAAYFQRNQEAMEAQLKELGQSFRSLKELTEGDR